MATPVPQWGWAVYDRTGPRDTLAIAASPDPDDVKFFVSPVVLGKAPHPFVEDETLQHWGWDPVTTWKEHPRPSWRVVCRVRPTTSPRDKTPRPYAADLAWAFGTPPAVNPEPDSLSEMEGPDSGWMYTAFQVIAGTDPYGVADSLAGDKRRQWIDQAHATVGEFRTWIRAQIREHGWLRTGIDPTAAEAALLNWATSDPDNAWRAEAYDLMRPLVESCEVDPDHLATLEATLGRDLLTPEEVDALTRDYLDYRDNRPKDARG